MLSLNEALTLAEKYDNKLKGEDVLVTAAEVRHNQIGGMLTGLQVTVTVSHWRSSQVTWLTWRRSKSRIGNLAKN